MRDLSRPRGHRDALPRTRQSKAEFRYLMFESCGRGGEPLATVESLELHTPKVTGHFRRWFSSAPIVASVLSIWIDWRSDSERVSPSILAWKLITTALVFIPWEAAPLAQKYAERRFFCARISRDISDLNCRPLGSSSVRTPKLLTREPSQVHLIPTNIHNRRLSNMHASSRVRFLDVPIRVFPSIASDRAGHQPISLSSTHSHPHS